MVNDGALVVAPCQFAVAFDDERLVADAGIVLPATLAARLGIEALVDEAVDLDDRPGAANSPFATTPSAWAFRFTRSRVRSTKSGAAT